MNHTEPNMQSVPFIAYESLATHAQRTNKRTLFVLAGTVALCIACLGWAAAGQITGNAKKKEAVQ